MRTPKIGMNDYADKENEKKKRTTLSVWKLAILKIRFLGTLPKGERAEAGQLLESYLAFVDSHKRDTMEKGPNVNWFRVAEVKNRISK